MKKQVIIGIDGVPYELMDDLSEKGIMPNFKELKNKGVFKKMRSTLPHISSVSWSSIITGRNPGEHGIFGFTELKENSYDLSFPNFNNLKQQTFWQKNPERKYVILNVPSTYPVKEINGVHVSGFVSLDFKNSLFPLKHFGKLKEFNYKVDVNSGLAHESIDLFLKQLFEVTESRIKAYRYFWDNLAWDTFMLVFTGSDRLGHFLWEAYENENHQYYQAFINYFKRIDEIIGEISIKITDETSLVILSDHGMEKLKENFNVNTFLVEQRFLDLDLNFQGYNQITNKTKAFCLDPGRIYLNKKGKYPKGEVSSDQAELIIKELETAFYNLERNGEKVIKKVYRKEDIYYGEELSKAPDLVLIENKGYRLRGKMNAPDIFDKDIFTGDHSLENSFLYVRGNNLENIIPDNVTVENVVEVIEKLNN